MNASKALHRHGMDYLDAHSGLSGSSETKMSLRDGVEVHLRVLCSVVSTTNAHCGSLPLSMHDVELGVWVDIEIIVNI